MPPSLRRADGRLDPQMLIPVVIIAVALYALRSHIDNKTTGLILLVVIPSIILHEISHGVVALAFGDDTAKRAGRLTLNPIRHIDPIGTLVLPAILAISGLGVFGYAKPVPVAPSRMRSPRNDSLIVSLAGPATNLVLAGVSILLLRYACPAGTAKTIVDTISFGDLSAVGTGEQILYLLGFLNVTLAVFNLIPIPPLDGSAVIERLLPRSALPTWNTIRQWSMLVLLVIVLLDPSGLQREIFAPAERAWARLLAA